MSVFEASFVNDLHCKYHRLPSFQRPLMANIALEEQRAENRSRIEAWVQRLDPEDGEKIIPLLRQPSRFLRAYGELAVAQLLLDAGCDIRYAQNIDGLQPAWICEHDDSRFLCDVFTAGLHIAEAAYETTVMHLAGRLAAIAQPYLVRLDVVPDFALTPCDQKVVAAEVATWLALGVFAGDDWSGHGCTVTVLGAAQHRVDVIVTDEGYTTPTPESIATTLREKAEAYNAVDMPLLVGIVKHPRAEADVVTFQDGVLGVARYRSVQREDGSVASGVARKSGGGFDGRADLSAALWFHPYRGANSEKLLLTNAGAVRPLPPAVVARLDTSH